MEREKEKKAVVCLAVILSPKRSADVTHATSMCTCAKTFLFHFKECWWDDVFVMSEVSAS